MEEKCKQYNMKTECMKKMDGRYSVAVWIYDSVWITGRYYEDKITLILKEEAEKESLNMGRNLIDRYAI